jgi:predicted lipoprotein with Yx(FWY)xxD motif
MMKSQRVGLLALVAAFMISACIASAASTGVASTMPTFHNGILVDQNGMTLYVLSKDEPGKSVCDDKCASLWPPLLAPSGAAASADFSVITREDGGKQWAYKGHPLYLYWDDKAPGQRTGDGRKGIWSVVKP